MAQFFVDLDESNVEAVQAYAEPPLTIAEVTYLIGWRFRNEPVAITARYARLKGEDLLMTRGA